MATSHPLVGRYGLLKKRRLTVLLAGGLLGAAAIAGAGLASGILGESPAPAGAPTVVLAHGLGRTPASMAVLAGRLEQAGFSVVRFGYPSRTEPIETLVDRLEEAVAECCRDNPGAVHFVTHSMGGVLVRSYLSERSEPHEGRVVMLSPPNQGSEIVDAFADSDLLRSFLGPAGVAARHHPRRHREPAPAGQVQPRHHHRQPEHEPHRLLAHPRPRRRHPSASNGRTSKARRRSSSCRPPTRSS